MEEGRGSAGGELTGATAGRRRRLGGRSASPSVRPSRTEPRQDQTDQFSVPFSRTGPVSFFVGPGYFGPVHFGPRAGPKARLPRPP